LSHQFLLLLFISQVFPFLPGRKRLPPSHWLASFSNHEYRPQLPFFFFARPLSPPCLFPNCCRKLGKSRDVVQLPAFIALTFLVFSFPRIELLIPDVVLPVNSYVPVYRLFPAFFVLCKKLVLISSCLMEFFLSC